MTVPSHSALATDHTLNENKRRFIEFLLDCDVLRFGDFTTKSGRRTPYFLDAGRYNSGLQLDALGQFYANAIEEQLQRNFNLLFGPAYKGIPLVCTTSAQFARRGHDVGFCFNRKEAKTHGEGGVMVGKQPAAGDRVVIVEDVTTAGTSIRETMPLLRSIPEVEVAALVVSVDRQERGPSGASALTELSSEFDMKTFSIVTIEEVIHYLRQTLVNGQTLLTPELDERVRAYRREYGG